MKLRKYSELVLAAAAAGKLTEERPFEAGKQVLRHHGLTATKPSRNRAGQAFKQLIDDGRLVRDGDGWRHATQKEQSARPIRLSARRRELCRKPKYRFAAA